MKNNPAFFNLLIEAHISASTIKYNFKFKYRPPFVMQIGLNNGAAKDPVWSKQAML